MKNLLIVAHPDDEILGFGGAGASYASLGEIVQPVILCGGAKARSNRPSNDKLANNIQEANKVVGFNNPILGSYPNLEMNTVPHLNMVKFIEEQICSFQPDRIFTHHPYDLNEDHREVSKACMAAFRIFQRKKNIKSIRELYFMEILSSTDWSFPVNSAQFSPNVFIDISQTYKKKIKALSCYEGILREPPHPRSIDTLHGHAMYRGGQSGFLLAEAFQQVYRSKL